MTTGEREGEIGKSSKRAVSLSCVDCGVSKSISEIEKQELMNIVKRLEGEWSM